MGLFIWESWRECVSAKAITNFMLMEISGKLCSLLFLALFCSGTVVGLHGSFSIFYCVLFLLLLQKLIVFVKSDIMVFDFSCHVFVDQLRQLFTLILFKNIFVGGDGNFETIAE